MRRLRQQAPFALAAVVFLAMLALLTHLSIRANDGVLVYSLDDAYIHMALAKNLAEHGVFGVTRFSFSSSTSSPLWTLLLAISYKIVGVSDCVPGILATFFALLTLYATHALCRALQIRAIGRLVVCVLVVFFTPMVPLVSTGMEHTMHACFAAVLLLTTLTYASRPRRRTFLWMCTAGVLAVAARYESLFLVAPLCLWLLSMRYWRAAVALGILSFLPVIIYGVFSVSNGSFFLPNAVMLKGGFPSIDGPKDLIKALGFRAVANLARSSDLYAISILLLLGCSLHGKTNRRSCSCALCLIGSILLHVQFASTGWLYRYEAYLIAISLPVLGSLYSGFHECPYLEALRKYRRENWGALFLLAVLLLSPLLYRAAKSLDDVVPASHHIYRQQYHMGHFLRRMYPSGVRVALGDLGAVAYYADADILDLWGLGTIEVARARREGEYDARAVLKMLQRHQPQVTMIHPGYFTGIWPDAPIPIAEWTVANEHWEKGRTLTFYALSESAAADLERRLLEYEEHLPESVEVRYLNTETRTGLSGRSAPRGKDQ